MKITMSSENEQVNASLAMIGDISTTTYFKGQKSRTEMKSPMTGNNTTIIDNSTKEMLVLLDNPMLGKKYLKNTMDVSDEDLKNIDVTETGDTKTILGYKCKGYNVTVNKDGTATKMTMYTTDKISAPNQNSTGLGGKIKGYPMYMVLNISQSGMPMKTTMEVTEIKNESINNSKLITKEGKTYFVINDYAKLRVLFGELLSEIQRIKSEGDFEAGKALVETYGVKVDRS